MSDVLKAPFPWFGGKSRIASLVWSRLGNVPNLVEPFFGSGAVLFARPHPAQLETVNDVDGFVSNFWRAVQSDPEAVARYADWPVSECDLHARHIWLVNRKESLQAKIEGDPEWFDAKAAGWWVWGICCWIGSGWCSGTGPWQSVDGKMTKVENGGVWRQLPHLGNAGLGVNRKLPHLGNAGLGVNRKLPHLGSLFSDGTGVVNSNIDIYAWFEALSIRLRRVRVCCGDWSRVMGPSVTFGHGITGVFLDPPYSTEAGRDMGIYAKDSGSVAHGVRRWAIENGDNPLLRIALCGYADEHEIPDSWECVAWKTAGGYASQGRGETNGKANRGRERIWFSPACVRAKQVELEV